MMKTRIEDGFRILLPEAIRAQFHVGETLLIEADNLGRIVITPAETIIALLRETFGMWNTASDSEDGVQYMDRMRQGSRIDEVD